MGFFKWHKAQLLSFSVPLCTGVSACLSGGFLIRKTGVISVVALLAELPSATAIPWALPCVLPSRCPTCLRKARKLFSTCLWQQGFTFLSKSATDIHVTNYLLISAACSTAAAYEHLLRFLLQAGLLKYASLGLLTSTPQKIQLEQIGTVCLAFNANHTDLSKTALHELP